MKTVPITLAALLMLAGCANQVERSGPPAPIEQRGGSGADADYPDRDGPVISAYEPPEPVDIGRPRPARAVEVLAMRAEDQRRTGKLSEAAASIERALRIAPRDALLWHRLALVRRDQRRFGEAVELATKSNSLARDDVRLRQDNWRLIAAARRSQGDASGARAADRRASELR